MHKKAVKTKTEAFFASVLFVFDTVLVNFIVHFVKFFYLLGIECYNLKNTRAIVRADTVFVNVLNYFFAFSLTHTMSIAKKKKVIQKSSDALCFYRLPHAYTSVTAIFNKTAKKSA